jgi:hypothetical protein
MFMPSKKVGAAKPLAQQQDPRQTRGQTALHARKESQAAQMLLNQGKRNRIDDTMAGSSAASNSSVRESEGEANKLGNNKSE